jgi:hypothetical protein
VLLRLSAPPRQHHDAKRPPNREPHPWAALGLNPELMAVDSSMASPGAAWSRDVSCWQPHDAGEHGRR